MTEGTERLLLNALNKSNGVLIELINESNIISVIYSDCIVILKREDKWNVAVLQRDNTIPIVRFYYNKIKNSFYSTLTSSTVRATNINEIKFIPFEIITGTIHIKRSVELNYASIFFRNLFHTEQDTE
jgi:hypothetical protein